MLYKFKPSDWQISFFDTLHTWLIHMSVWRFWFWFTFIIFMSMFFYFHFKSLYYFRVDIRGFRSAGEKRRVAWPEMLIVIFPLFWAINIISNAFSYLKILEGGSGYVFLAVQVVGYQWGWKYCYSDTFYLKFYSNHLLVGENSLISPGEVLNWKTYSNNYKSDYSFMQLIRFNDNIKNHTPSQGFNVISYLKKLPSYLDYEGNTDNYFSSINDSYFLHDITKKKFNEEFLKEVYFCRSWLKDSGVLENERKQNVQNKLWHSGFWITSQGLDSTDITIENIYNDSQKYISDPLRLFRSSGALVLPSRSTLRLMSSSEDITHSWAVPGLGFKMDCVPGRLFCLYTNIVRDGIYFGQCSELCGWNHYNMPVVVYSLPIEHFIIWWELELHSIFEDPKKDFSSVRDDSGVYKNYSLLSLKYK